MRTSASRAAPFSVKVAIIHFALRVRMVPRDSKVESSNMVGLLGNEFHAEREGLMGARVLTLGAAVCGPASWPSIHSVWNHVACVDTAMEQTVPAWQRWHRTRRGKVECDTLQAFTAFPRNSHEIVSLVFSFLFCGCQRAGPCASRSRFCAHSSLHSRCVGYADTLDDRLPFAGRHQGGCESGAVSSRRVACAA